MPPIEFHSTATEFVAGNALALARAAQLAYAPPEEIRTTLTEWDVQFFGTYGTQAFLAASDDALLLAFRGTEEPDDLIANFKVRLVAEGSGRVHRGFRDALDDVWPAILHRVRDQSASRPLWLTGHSLGADLATIAAARVVIDDQVAL